MYPMPMALYLAVRVTEGALAQLPAVVETKPQGMGLLAHARAVGFPILSGRVVYYQSGEQGPPLEVDGGDPLPLFRHTFGTGDEASPDLWVISGDGRVGADYGLDPRAIVLPIPGVAAGTGMPTTPPPAGGACVLFPIETLSDVIEIAGGPEGAVRIWEAVPNTAVSFAVNRMLAGRPLL